MPINLGTAGFRAGFLSDDIKKAIAWGRRRAVMDKPTFDALSFDNKLTSWTVAGDLTEKSILGIQRAVNTAIEQGVSYRKFTRMLTPDVIRNITAPRIVYHNAVNNAYQKGRFDQQTRLKELRPFLQYVTFGDERVRPNHAAMNGKVARQGSSFWAVNYPPNGHGCRCTARALSRANVNRRGLNVQTKAEIERDVQREQTAKGVPLHKQAKPIADKEWRGSFTEGSFGAEPMVKTFGKPPSALFNSILTAKPVNIIPRSTSLAQKAQGLEVVGKTQAAALKNVEDKIFAVKANEFAAVIDENGVAMTFEQRFGSRTVKKGGKSSVKFTEDEVARMEKMINAVLTHSHPSGLSFSLADFEFHHLAGLKELRAVGITRSGTRYLYRLSGEVERSQRMAYLGTIKRRRNSIKRRVKKDFEARLRRGEITAKFYNDNLYHEINGEVARSYGLKYSRRVVQ